MSFLYISKTVKQLWDTEWPNNIPSYFDNVVAEELPNNSPWVRVSVRDGSGIQISLGNPSLDRHTGIVFINVFVPINEGQERARWIADAAARIFRKKSVNNGEGSLIFDVPYVMVSASEGTADDVVNTGWWQLNVLCPYTFDEVT